MRGGNLVLNRLRRGRSGRSRRFRRGVYLLPSIFTLANLFCGYACIVYAMREEYQLAAPFIGFAIVLDMLDGRIARLTGTATPFGLQFDSLADLISFGLAPAILTFNWGLEPLGRLGWAASFIFVTAAALRLARFNIQSAVADKRYFAGMPSPAAAGIPAATVFAYPYALEEPVHGLLAVAIMLIPAFLMVSTMRFRSFKTVDLRARRSYKVLALVALILAVVAVHPRAVLVAVAYTYLLSGFVELALTRLRRRTSERQHDPETQPAERSGQS
jgi:CDP-diacylglycerol---serine O-phosphatidyltransferase